MLKFYSEFTQQNNDQESLRVRTAGAYQRIGQIQTRLGDIDAAIESFHASLDLLFELNDKTPENGEYVLNISEVLNDLGLAFAASSRGLPEIVSAHKAAAEFLERQTPAWRPCHRYALNAHALSIWRDLCWPAVVLKVPLIWHGRPTT